MSTPLFEREPTNGSGIDSILGASLAAFNGSSTPMVELTTVSDEPVLIDELLFCVEKFSTQAGQLIVALLDSEAPGYGNRRVIGAYPIPAGSSTLFASGRIELNFTIEPGYRLVAAHDVKDVSSAYAELHVVPMGGVVR